MSVYAALSQLQSNKLCKYTYVCANVQTNVHILKLQIELVSESLEHTRCFYAAKNKFHWMLFMFSSLVMLSLRRAMTIMNEFDGFAEWLKEAKRR